MKETKVVIFGTGKSAQIVQENLCNYVKITAFLDNNTKKQGMLHNNIHIYSPSDLNYLEWDYVIIGSIHYEEIEEQLIGLAIPMNNVISFFSNKFRKKALNDNIFVSEWKVNALQYNLNHLEQSWNAKFNLLINNLGYEVVDKLNKNMYKFPEILPGEMALAKILKENCSMSRFGDGEFELMAMKYRPKFQEPNEKLAIRLKEVLDKKLDNHIVALADNYGSLEQYNAESAMAIREYMTEKVREYHMSVLDLNRTYYDTYVSRPYIIYKNKDRAHSIFQLFKKIWDKRDVVIVEGDRTRTGIGNDLLSNARSVRRIIAPNENAFDVYDKIMNGVCKLPITYLILIALGPTATVLAYDLAREGYQAIDVGHLDIEYEWFLRGCSKRIDLPNKYVNEVTGGEKACEELDENYEKEIIMRIS